VGLPAVSCPRANLKKSSMDHEIRLGLIGAGNYTEDLAWYRGVFAG
jgi:hypothetical protein